MKVAKNSEEAWQIQHTFEGATAWIQWKATNVFMDVTCKCGANGNVSGEFAYFIRCTNCGAIYMLNGHIELIQCLDDPKASTLDIE